jgi:hypothetical protein
MLFPNFYVPSVRLAVVELFGFPRMSLSHLEHPQGDRLRINLEFTSCESTEVPATARNDRNTPSDSRIFSTPQELFHGSRVSTEMKLTLIFGVAVLSVGLGCALAVAQQYADPSAPPPPRAMAPDESPVPLEWVPPALAELSAEAPVKSNFTLDRTMLGVAAGLVPDADAPTRQAINKLDGVSVHTMRFGEGGIPDERAVEAIRASYHLRGWKHLVTTSDHGGPVHDGTTDVWVVLDGANVRGAVVLAETPRSLTLVTVAGNLSPVDIMHLRGHFGIPQLDRGDFHDAPVQ